MLPCAAPVSNVVVALSASFGATQPLLRCHKSVSVSQHLVYKTCSSRASLRAACIIALKAFLKSMTTR